MSSDLHKMSCTCPDCRTADNQPRRIGPRGMAWAAIATALIAFWCWLLAPLASALFPALTF